MASDTTSALLQPISIGGSIPLRNRASMGSMTRNRCIDDNKPTQAVVDHYTARAKDGTGLIITEGTFIYLHGCDYPHAPVLYKDEHAEAWRKVTDSVHREGAVIFYQAWHPEHANDERKWLPRVSAVENTIERGKYRHIEGMPGHSDNITEITDPDEIIEQYRNSFTLAKKAGFDGVEILAQGGFLLQNFLGSNSNQRTDKYGGSSQNRCRFVLEVVDAILDIWSPEHVGIKICPTDNLYDSALPYPEISETYTYLVKQLMARELGFINLSRRGCDLGPSDDIFTSARPTGTELPSGYEPLHEFGPMIKYPGSKTLLMVNHGYSVEEAEGLVQQGKIDLVGFGRAFIYNPDVITRIKKNIAFATNDRGGVVFYGPYKDPNENYNDWPYAREERVE